VTTVADHRPQQAWAPRNLLAGTPEEEAALPAAGKGCKRPLWMLPEPALLHAEKGCPLHLGPLRLIDGPERLETGWWDDDGIARDYYTAVNPRGMRLWVFRDRNPHADWYLHGFFG
jgi:protein ImuB